MKIKILKAGPLTTVQDRGRFGYLEYGIGESGAMDRDSYEKANWLVGNKSGEAMLEATLMGPTIVFDCDTLLAYMGADMDAKIENKSINRGQTYRVLAGQKVVFGFAKSGVRAYIAVAGGIEVPPVLGSRSTNLKCEMGGFQGRKLLDNDVIEAGNGRYSEGDIEKLLKRQIKPDEYTTKKTVRVIMGPQDDYFTENGRRKFLEEDFLVTPESDRMGIRLSGPVIEGNGSMDIISDGITFGSVQVTSGGLPIILMADHQTTGGYAKIATVLKEDLPCLAQARPGDTIRFTSVTIEDVQKRKGIRKWITKITCRARSDS